MLFESHMYAGYSSLFEFSQERFLSRSDCGFANGKPSNL